MNQRRTENLLKANNIVFLAAIFLSPVSGWFMFLAIAFWVFTLIYLTTRDIRAKSISIATIAYTVMSVLLIALLCYVAAKSAGA